MIEAAVMDALLDQPVLPNPDPVVIPCVATKAPVIVIGAVTDIPILLVALFGVVIVAKVTLLAAVKVALMLTAALFVPVPLWQLAKKMGEAAEKGETMAIPCELAAVALLVPLSCNVPPVTEKVAPPKLMPYETVDVVPLIPCKIKEPAVVLIVPPVTEMP